jgi:hypothetical protein
LAQRQGVRKSTLWAARFATSSKIARSKLKKNASAKLKLWKA